MRELALTYGHLDAEHNSLAVQRLQKAAQAGDAQAQFELAQAWYDGNWGLRVDMVEAWKWFERSGTAGNGKASFMLARMASHGQGVPQDAALVTHWLQESSRQGNAQAMYQLSVAYFNGDGIAQNIMQSRYWLTMSAEHDYAIAVQALAMQLDNLGGHNSPWTERSRHLFKEASDHRLMRWNTQQ